MKVIMFFFSTHMFEMKNNFDLDENVTFTFQNFMDDYADIDYSFHSNDGQRYLYSRSEYVSPGKKRACSFKKQIKTR